MYKIIYGIIKKVRYTHFFLLYILNFKMLYIICYLINYLLFCFIILLYFKYLFNANPANPILTIIAAYIV